MTKPVFETINTLSRSRKSFAIATVIEVEGSSSAKPGARAVINDEGDVVSGWVGGGCAQSICCERALESLHTGQPVTIEIDMSSDELGKGLPCGGRMKVFIEPVLPVPHLWLVGQGRLAESLCELASEVGLSVIVVAEDAKQADFPSATNIIFNDPDYHSLMPASQDFVVIATQHRDDHLVVQQLLATDARYIGLVASHKRATLVQEFLHQVAIPEAIMARLVTPCGLELGAATPEEIALSIISEITLIRRKGNSTEKIVRLGRDKEVCK